jgi:hypothetical protein
MRHNQKNYNKILLLEDQFILKNLIPGATIFHNCLGEMYRDIVDLTASGRYNNLVLINNLEFKYKTVDQINNWVLELAEQVLLPGGRIIMSVNHQFLIYNRVGVSVDALTKTWFDKFNKIKLIKFLNLLNKSNPGYGDYFFCVEYA